MPGPAPKDPRTRQRRNKVSTAAELPSSGVLGRIAPGLPVRAKDERPWHAETLSYWRDVWASEVVGEFLAVDVPGLVALFKLIDMFNYGLVDLAAEIRLQRQCFGLTPMDRRRLQWSTPRKKGADSGAIGQAVAPPPQALDPRRSLRAVK